MSYADKNLPDTLEKLNGTVVFDPDSVVVEKATAKFGGGDVTLTGKMVDHLPYFLPAEKENRENLKKPTFTFAAHSSRVDVDRLFPLASPGASGPGGRAAVPDTLAPIPNILGQGTIRADTLIYSRVPFTEVVGKVRLRNRVLECYDVSGRVYGGGVTGKVTVDLNNLNDPGYGGDFKAVDIEANSFLTRFIRPEPGCYRENGDDREFQRPRARSGQDQEHPDHGFDRRGDQRQAGARPVRQLVLGYSGGGVGQSLDKEQALKDLTTLIKVEDGRVGLESFQSKLGNFGDLTLGGSYGFDGGLDYQGALLLTKEQTARLYATGGLTGSVARLFGDKAERLRLPLTVEGTMTRPQMQLDFSELTNNLKSQLQRDSDDSKDKLDKKLKGLLGK